MVPPKKEMCQNLDKGGTKYIFADKFTKTNAVTNVIIYAVYPLRKKMFTTQ